MLTYRQTIAEIESFGVMPERPPSIEPVRRALKALGLDQRIDPAKVIVVAGTNGKGSVSATLSTLLQSAGKRTGLFTSPHLMESTERIRIAGNDIDRESFANAYAAIRDCVLELKLTHFETLTVLAAWVFFADSGFAPVDYAVFEVGLGGVWDATNAIPHSFCVITRLGLDHQNLLGSGILNVARNKFGIVHSQAKVVHAPLPPETLPAAQEVRERTHSSWIEAPLLVLETIAPTISVDLPRYYLQTPWGKTETSLVGPRGAENASIAIKAFQELGFDPGDHLAALASIRWPGRMERFPISGARCPAYLSGDHNPQGIASLIDLLPAYPRNELHCLIGVGQDKDLDGIIGPLADLPQTSIHLTETPFRGRSLKDYGIWLKRARSGHSDPASAFTQVLDIAQSGDLILVTGSLYLVGSIRALSSS